MKTSLGPEQIAILGIDPSIKNTGVVVIDGYGNVLFTVEYSMPAKALKQSMYPGKENTLINDNRKAYLPLMYIRDGLRKTLDYIDGVFLIESIVAGYENYSYGSTHKAERLGELGGLLRTLLIDYDVPFKLFAPTQIKKFAVKSGHATKEQMMCQLQRECSEATQGQLRTNKETISGDICDAYYIAKMMWYLCLPKLAQKYDTTPLLRHRLEMVTKLA